MCKENNKGNALPFDEFSSELSFRVFSVLTSLMRHNPNLVCSYNETFSEVGIIEVARRARKIAGILSGADPLCSCE
jgi:hypothetical protein